MSAITASSPSRTDQSERRLRAVLSVNAVTSLVAGAAGLLAANWWSDRLGIDSSAWTRIVSAGLVLFALDVAFVARARTGRLRPLAAAVSAADLAWVVATVVVVAVGALNGAGVAVALAVGVAVLDFALLQLWYRSRLGRERRGNQPT
jgi:O-antigen/teichoic acid export membrane protein